MNTTAFYTLLRIMPNPASGEAVVVGLVLFDGMQHEVRVSKRKLKLAILLARNAEAAIRYAIRQIEARVETDTIARSQAMVSERLPELTQLMSRSDWEYLTKYSNGLLRVDHPMNVAMFDGDNPALVFNQLYTSLVDSDDSVKQPKRKTLVNESVKTLIQRVKPQVHTNITLTPKLLPDLFFNLRLDCIGMNGSLIGAHSLHLEQLSMDTLQQHFSECRFAIKSLSKHYKPQKPQSNILYLLADEPDERADPDKHKFWRAIQEEPMLKVIPTDEAELIADQIERTGARTFLNTPTNQHDVITTSF
ncbi:DUF3037 domain-containing protein [Hymenobacter metallilatus]|uniref:DUF3037 domain-containing protein n=1 Tax=Hymenobacter metallilatus TaxID=2493666 RepID=A0A3R9MP88_9BACT|nr:DUF3037 domain-containing protein [Hymenobacter metallilatus]RSK37314.1 DUF3037 domain-containing protein [Hymenobacter metallilatus]